MKRGWNNLHDQEAEGSDESYRLAQALAAISDPEFLRSAIAVKSALDQWGGQAMVAAQRERVNVLGRRDPEGQIHVTIGYVWHFKHVPDALKDALREPSPDSLENVEPIEWMDETPLTDEQMDGLVDVEETVLGDPEPLTDEELEAEFLAEVDAETALEAEAEARAEDPGDPAESDHQAEREADLAAREK